MSAARRLFLIRAFSFRLLTTVPALTTAQAAAATPADSVGRLVCFSHKQGHYLWRAHGTGFVIDAEGHVVSNSHVIGHMCDINTGQCTSRSVCDKLIIFFSEKDHSELEIVEYDARKDLALLKMQGLSRPFLTVYGGGGDSLKPSMDLHVWGFPGAAETRVLDEVMRFSTAVANGARVNAPPPKGSMTPVFTRDNLSKWSEQDNRSVLTIPNAINQGNSGGPVLDTCGRVVGISTYKAGNSLENFGFAVDIAEMLPMLKRNRASGTILTNPCVPPAQGAADVPTPKKSESSWFQWVVIGLVLLTVLLATAATVIALRRPQVRQIVSRISRLLKLSLPLAHPPVANDTSYARFSLLFIGGALRDFAVEIGDNTLAIGRDPGVCDIVISESEGTQTISPKHLEVRITGGRPEVRDVYSGNGTYIAGSALAPGLWTPIEPARTIKLASSDVALIIRKDA